LGRSTSLAALATVRKAGRDAPRPPGGHSQLLPHEGPAGSGRSRERKHQVTATMRSGLQEFALSAPEGAADGGNQDGIHHSPESSLKCAFHQILAQNRKSVDLRYVRLVEQFTNALRVHQYLHAAHRCPPTC